MYAVYALYDGNTFLRRLLPFLFCAEAVTVSFVFAFVFPSIKFGQQCAVFYMPVAAIGFL
jgi:hypothetical protein